MRAITTKDAAKLLYIARNPKSKHALTLRDSVTPDAKPAANALIAGKSHPVADALRHFLSRCGKSER